MCVSSGGQERLVHGELLCGYLQEFHHVDQYF